MLRAMKNHLLLTALTLSLTFGCGSPSDGSVPLGSEEQALCTQGTCRDNPLPLTITHPYPAYPHKFLAVIPGSNPSGWDTQWDAAGVIYAFFSGDTAPYSYLYTLTDSDTQSYYLETFATDHVASATYYYAGWVCQPGTCVENPKALLVESPWPAFPHKVRVTVPGPLPPSPTSAEFWLEGFGTFDGGTLIATKTSPSAFVVTMSPTYPATHLFTATVHFGSGGLGLNYYSANYAVP